MSSEKERVYSDAEVEARLKQELPHWFLEKGWIRRKYKTHSWKGTLMVVNTVGHLAEAAWHHPDITASYAWLEVRLAGRNWACSHGFSMADVAAAPALFYADWVRPIPETAPLLRAYRARLNARQAGANDVTAQIDALLRESATRRAAQG